jgi:hypothetical protein
MEPARAGWLPVESHLTANSHYRFIVSRKSFK